MNQSIYTEYANLTPYHIKWLDECGAKWASGFKISEHKNEKVLLAEDSNDSRYYFYAHFDKNKHTHLPTGDAFCQGVAEILGIEYKSENAVFSNKELEALNSISIEKPLTRKLINKLELHDRMERPLREKDFSEKYKAPEILLKRICIKRDILRNDQKACDWLDTTPIRWNNKLNFIFSQWNGCDATHIGFDSNSFLHIYRNDKKDFVEVKTVEEFCEYISKCCGVTISKTETTTEDKGLAIDVKLLSEKDREWLVENIYNAKHVFAGLTDINPYIAMRYGESLGYGRKEFIEKNGLPITTDPNEFMRYIADKTGKEWDKSIDQKLSENVHIKEVIALENLKAGESVASKEYPHKAYRVLDSLDAVPLDTRIPLSEWIPPFGKEVIIINSFFFRGTFYAIVESGIEFKDESETIVVIPLDGHWMRIV